MGTSWVFIWRAPAEPSVGGLRLWFYMAARSEPQSVGTGGFACGGHRPGSQYVPGGPQPGFHMSSPGWAFICWAQPGCQENQLTQLGTRMTAENQLGKLQGAELKLA